MAKTLQLYKFNYFEELQSSVDNENTVINTANRYAGQIYKEIKLAERNAYATSCCPTCGARDDELLYTYWYHIVNEAMKVRKEHRNIIPPNELGGWMAQLERVTEEIKPRYAAKHKAQSAIKELAIVKEENDRFQSTVDQTMLRFDSIKLDAQSKKEQFEEQLGQIQVELSAAKNEIMTLREESSQYSTELDNVKADYDEQRLYNEQIVTNNVQLTATNEQLSTANEAMTTKLDQLVRTNETLGQFRDSFARNDSNQSDIRICDSLVSLECKICFEADEEKDCLPHVHQRHTCPFCRAATNTAEIRRLYDP